MYILYIYFSIQNIKSNCYIIFLNFFSSHLFLMENLFLLSYIYLEKGYFLLFFADLFLFLHDLTQLLQPIESISYLFYW